MTSKSVLPRNSPLLDGHPVLQLLVLIFMESIDVDQLFNGVAQSLNRELSTQLKGDCVFVSSAMVPPLDDVFRVSIEAVQDPKNPQDHLIVMLETNGGYIETVERIGYRYLPEKP